VVLLIVVNKFKNCGSELYLRATFLHLVVRAFLTCKILNKRTGSNLEISTEVGCARHWNN